MEKKRAEVIGAGYVGLATAVALLRSGWDVLVSDTDSGRLMRHAYDMGIGVDPLGEPGMAKALAGVWWAYRGGADMPVGDNDEPDTLVFVCVGTPAGSDGSIDCSAAVNVAIERAVMRGQRVVVRSTVTPAAARAMEAALDTVSDPDALAIAPEFLREGHAVADALSPSRWVIGCRSVEWAEHVWGALGGYGNGVRHDGALHHVQPTEAALVKLASNGMLALRAWYADAIASTCEDIGGNAAAVLYAIGADRRIGPLGLRPGLGVGGPCLPKDLGAVVDLDRFQALSVVADGLDDATRNVAHVVESAFGAILDPTARVVILGVGFKPDSADWRNSPAVALAESLRCPVTVADDRLTASETSALRAHFDRYEERDHEIQIASEAAAMCSDVPKVLVLAKGPPWPAMALAGMVAAVVDAYALMMPSVTDQVLGYGTRLWVRGRGWLRSTST